MGYPVGVLAFGAGPSKNFRGSSFMKSDIHDRPIAVVRSLLGEGMDSYGVFPTKKFLHSEELLL